MNKGKKTRKKRKHSKKSVIEEVELKLEAQERLSEINRKREKEALQAQKNEELRIREHQVILYTYCYLFIFIWSVHDNPFVRHIPSFTRNGLFSPVMSGRVSSATATDPWHLTDSWIRLLCVVRTGWRRWADKISGRHEISKPYALNYLF